MSGEAEKQPFSKRPAVSRACVCLEVNGETGRKCDFVCLPTTLLLLLTKGNHGKEECLHAMFCLPFLTAIIS